MSINLTPNGALYNQKFGMWTTVLTGAGSAPVATYSATSGPNSTPGNTLSLTGTSGGVKMSYTVSNLELADGGILLVSAIVKASSASANITPVSVVFKNGTNTVATYIPLADTTAADTNFHAYSTPCAIPVGATSAVVELGWVHFTSTGGYTSTVASPAIYVL